MKIITYDKAIRALKYMGMDKIAFDDNALNAEIEEFGFKVPSFLAKNDFDSFKISWEIKDTNLNLWVLIYLDIMEIIMVLRELGLIYQLMIG